MSNEKWARDSDCHAESINLNTNTTTCSSQLRWNQFIIYSLATSCLKSEKWINLQGAIVFGLWDKLYYHTTILYKEYENLLDFRLIIDLSFFVLSCQHIIIRWWRWIDLKNLPHHWCWPVISPIRRFANVPFVYVLICFVYETKRALHTYIPRSFSYDT